MTIRATGRRLLASVGLRSGSVPLTTDLLQYDVRRPSRHPVDLVVGFDFGTSCTKVVIQSPTKLRGRAVAVDFEELGHFSSHRLLPTVITEASSGEVHLGAGTDRPGQVRNDLKIRLLEQEVPASPEELEGYTARAAAHVGLALRRARQWFLTAEQRNYGTDRFRWAMNFGVPSAGFDDDEIRERFHRVARAGWALSLTPEHVTLKRAIASVRAADRGSKSKVDATIEVVPEVAAQVVGYAKSRQRRDGLHLLVDIGASTIDVCAFLLHGVDGDDVYELLSAEVKQLGLLALHAARMRAAPSVSDLQTVPGDLVVPIPDWTGKVKLSPEVREQLERADAAYVGGCSRQVLYKVMNHVRKRRDPHSPHWETGLPIFVCGGGSADRVAPVIVRQAEAAAKKNWVKCKGFEPNLLPVPVSLAGGIEADSFRQRLSVAYGLSFDSFNIGTIDSPREIQDVPPDNRRGLADWKDRFVGMDQV